MPDHDADDDLDIEPRSADVVAARLQILQGVVNRAILEEQARAANTPPSEFDEDLFDLRAALLDPLVTLELTDRERAFTLAPAGACDDDELFSFALQAEALGMLKVLTRTGAQLPAPPQLISADAALVSLESGDAPTQVMASALRIPNEETLAELRETVELWSWRALAERERLQTTGPARRTIEMEIREVAAEAQEAGLIDAGPDGDFEAGGETPTRWSDDELAQFELASDVRLRAANWLCGFGTTWDDVPYEV